MRRPITGQCSALLLLLISIALLSACGSGDAPPPVADDSASPATNSQAIGKIAGDPAAAASRSVTAESLPYGDVDESLVYGYFAIPEDMLDPLPAVIVVHDWWGLDDNMRQSIERLAGAGFIALGVDLFGGETAESLADARNLEIRVVENPDLALENLRQAYDFLADTAGAPKIALLGFGFGGGWSLLATSEISGELGASISYYGQVHDNSDRLQRIGTPFLGLFAENDRAVPPDTVRRFEEALTELGKDVEIVLYPGKRRGFASPQSPNFDAATAEDAWRRMIQFLESRFSAEE